LQYWSPFPIDRTNNRKRSLTLSGVEAMKEIDIHSTDDNQIDLTYKCQIIYGTKATVCHLVVVDNKSGVEKELNPTGLVSSYEELLSSIFKIDKNYTTIGYLSPQMSSFISMNPGARYDMISEWMPDIEEYVVGYRNVTKKINTTNRQIKMIENEIGGISIESLIQNKSVIELKRAELEKRLEELKETRIRLSACEDRLQKTDRNEIRTRTMEVNAITRQLADRYKRLNDILLTRKKYCGKSGATLLSTDISNTEKDLITISSRLETVNSNIDSLKVQMKEKEYSLGLLNISDYDLNIDELISSLEEKVNKVRKVMEEYSGRYNFLEKLDPSFSNDSFAIIYSILDQVNDRCRSILTLVPLDNIDNLSRLISVNETRYKLLTDKISRLEEESKSILESITALKGTPLNPAILDLVPKICDIECGVITEIKRLLNPDVEITNLQEKLSDVYKEREATSTEIENISTSNRDIYSATNYVADIDGLLMKNKAAIVRLPEQLVDILTKDVGTIITNINYILSSIEHIREFISIRDQYNTYCEELKNLRVKESTVRCAIDMNDDIKKITTKIDELSNNKTDLIVKGKERDQTLTELLELRESLDSINKLVDEYNNDSMSHTLMIKRLEGIIDDWFRGAVISREITRIDMTIQETSNELLRYNMEFDSLNATIISKGTLVDSRDKLIESLKLLNLLQEACSPTSGVPAFFISNFLKKIHSLSNKYLQTLNGSALLISKFELGKSVREFPIEMEKDDGTIIPDASNCSEGQIALITLAVSMALISTIVPTDGYNVLRLDECDSMLDSARRGLFAGMVQDKMEEIGSRQSLIISHNNEFRNVPADIILMPGADVDSDMLANKKVLLDLSKVPIDQF